MVTSQMSNLVYAEHRQGTICPESLYIANEHTPHIIVLIVLAVILFPVFFIITTYLLELW